VDGKKFHDRTVFLNRFERITELEQANELHSELSSYIFPCVKEDFERSLPPTGVSRLKATGAGKKVNKQISYDKYGKMFDEQGPFKNADDFFKLFGDFRKPKSSKMALVVEEMKDENRYTIKQCTLAKKQGILHRSRRGNTVRVHIIMMSEVQVYHIKGLDKSCHYTIRESDVSLFEDLCCSFDLEVLVYHPDQDYHTSFLTIDNNASCYKVQMCQIFNVMPKQGLKERNSNLSISYGHSKRIKGISGGPPKQTRGMIDKAPDLIPLLVSNLLVDLTKELDTAYGGAVSTSFFRNVNFSQQMGGNFGVKPSGRNAFEGVDVSRRVLGPQDTSILMAHCDVLNDCREHYDFCTVLKAVVKDAAGEDNLLSVIAYTRRDVGDYCISENLNHQIMSDYSCATSVFDGIAPTLATPKRNRSKKNS